MTSNLKRPQSEGEGRKCLEEIVAASGITSGIPFGYRPTPLEYHAEMSRDLGIEVFIKREDMIDSLGCGNKLRKLSYVVADAERQGATVLVTMGSLRSNQCKAVAAVAARRGLRAHVIYGGDKQERPGTAQGSYLLTSFFEPTLTWCERWPWQDLNNEMARVVEEEKSRGEQPYLITAGASDWPGILGSIELGLEIADQAHAAGLSLTDVIAPAGSGGTCLGIRMAAERLRLGWRVLGFCIGEGAEIVTEKVAALRKESSHYIGDQFFNEGELVYDESARGAGYDTPSVDELSAMQSVVQHYGLMFDPNYMIKAFLGLRQAVVEGRIQRGSQVVLVHTGGQIGLFDRDDAFTTWYQGQYPDWIRDTRVST